MKILITAGASWIKVDDVRVFTNRFTGKTGLYLAKELKEKGHSITLLINPHCLGKVDGFKVIYYKYFDEFKKTIIKLLKKKKYDLIIHSAALSDYRLGKAYSGKISSKKKSIRLELIPTEKLIKKIRALAKESLLVQFKLEPKRRGIINKAYKSLRENKSDFVVANALSDLEKGYKAFLIDKNKKVTNIKSKKDLSTALDKISRGLNQL